MFLFPLLTLLIIIWIICYFISLFANSLRNNTDNSYINKQGYSLDKSIEILKERYAKGEINEEEFLKIKRNLEK